MNGTLARPAAAEAHILCALAALLLPVAALAAGLIWVLALAAALAVLALRLCARGPLPRTQIAVLSLAGAFVLLGLASSAWAIDPGGAAATAARIALVAASLALLLDAALRQPTGARQRLEAWLVGGSVLGIAIIAVLVATSGVLDVWFSDTLVSGHELDRLNRTSAVVAILVWPVALAVARRHGRTAAGLCLVLATLAMVALAPSTPLIAFLAGAGAFLVALVSQHMARTLVALAIAISILAVPFLDRLVPVLNEFMLAHIEWPNSEIHRFMIWDFAARRIFEKPIFGWGLDAARVIPGGKDEVVLFVSREGTTVAGPQLPLHTHNALIQIWLETGIVGALIVVAILAAVLRALPRSGPDRAGPACAIATMTSGFAIAQLSFGIWQGWWMATLGLMAVMVAALASSRIAAPAISAAVPDPAPQS
jgi:exopolysaccharide production protein ExoQ